MFTSVKEIDCYWDQLDLNTLSFQVYEKFIKQAWKSLDVSIQNQLLGEQETRIILSEDDPEYFFKLKERILQDKRGEQILKDKIYTRPISAHEKYIHHVSLSSAPTIPVFFCDSTTRKEPITIGKTETKLPRRNIKRNSRWTSMLRINNVEKFHHLTKKNPLNKSKGILSTHSRLKNLRSLK